MTQNQTPAPSICCSEHPNLPIQRIDPSPAVKKHAYCFECLLQTKEANSLYIALPTIPDFISSTAATFDKAKKQANCSDGPPNEYLEVLIGRSTTFNLLVKQLEQEKRKIEDFFDDIGRSIMSVINKKKDEYLKMIESQLATFNANYTFFEKELKRAYPKQEDLDKMFPSKAELEKRLARLGSAMELDSFVNEIKENFVATNAELNVITQPENKKRLRFDGFICNAKALEKNLPLFESKESYAQNIKDDIEKQLLKLLNNVFTLRNSIPDLCPSLDLNLIKDMLLTHENSLIIKEWLPSKYNFVPKLIYKGSRDMMTPEAFHSRCDGRGPTISLIKCQFSGSSEECVIGGFLDKDWHQKNEFIPSSEAFIFSLTSKTKCPIIQQDWAAQGYEDCGIIFGAGNDILIANNLSESYINERSYMNASQLIDSDTYSGSGRFYFKPIEIEVYSLV